MIGGPQSHQCYKEEKDCEAGLLIPCSYSEDPEEVVVLFVVEVVGVVGVVVEVFGDLVFGDMVFGGLVIWY